MKGIFTLVFLTITFLLFTVLENQDMELQLNHSKQTYCSYYQNCYENQDNTIYYFDKKRG